MRRSSRVAAQQRAQGNAERGVRGCARSGREARVRVSSKRGIARYRRTYASCAVLNSFFANQVVEKKSNNILGLQRDP